MDLLAYASSCSLITMGFVYLLEDKKKADRVIVFTFFLLWGTDTFLILWEKMSLISQNPHILYLSKPFELFYGPLIYYRFRLLIEGKIKFDILFLLLFLPGVLAVMYFIPFFALAPQEKLAYIGFHNIPNGPVRYIYLMIVLFYFIEKKYEKLFLQIQEDSSETRYKKSMVGNIDTDAFIERIQELMELEELYLDEKLSLQPLSSILEITAHQLSEILNSRLNTNFRSFVNRYRIDAAKKVLLEHEDTNILQAALSCGFNSKNTFNTAFHALEGMTPTEFLKKNRKQRHDL